MGSLIIKEVVNELLSKGLDKAKVLILAGLRWVLTNYFLINLDPPWVCGRGNQPRDNSRPSQQQLSLALSVISAGGIGVLVNLDHVDEQLRSLGHRGVQVRGLSDSGWFLETKQYKAGDCTHVYSCGPIKAAKLAFKWVGTIEGQTTPLGEQRFVGNEFFYHTGIGELLCQRPADSLT